MQHHPLSLAAASACIRAFALICQKEALHSIGNTQHTSHVNRADVRRDGSLQSVSLAVPEPTQT